MSARAGGRGKHPIPSPAAAFTAALLVLASGGWAATERMAVSAVVDPAAGTIVSEVRLTVVPEPGAEVVELLLNRRLEVTRVGADVGLAGFEHVTAGDGPYRYAPQATPLRLWLAAPASGGPILVELGFRGTVEPDAYGVIQNRDGWVELAAAYSGWAPVDPGAGTFALELRLRLPDGWRAVGTGGLRDVEGVWIAARERARDVVFIAAPGLQRIEVGGALSIHHVDLAEGVPELVAADAERVLELLTGWFGPAPSGSLDLVFTPRASGGGYARAGLVVMPSDSAPAADSGPQRGFVRFLAHELAHLWWQGADATSWEDWLNESFAETSALMVVRELFGEAAWSELLEGYREASAGLAPVRGIDRDDEAAWAVLYRKGPVLLAELEAAVGRDAFLGFLRARLADGCATTEACLATLARSVSPEARARLEAALDR